MPCPATWAPRWIQDFINAATDNNHPTLSLGPNGLDRTHQFSFGGTVDLPGSFRFGSVGHIYSPLPTNLLLPGGGAGGIFISDVTGDGSGDGSGVYGPAVTRCPAPSWARMAARSRPMI